MSHFKHLYVRIREGLLILSMAFSAFLLLSLVTYHRADPGWSHAAAMVPAMNAGGLVGAWLSDIFLYLCGYLAYLFPVICIYGSWLYYRNRSQEGASKLHRILIILLRIIGFSLMISAGAGLISLFLHPQHALLPFSTGGILGYSISVAMLHVFNLLGTTLILIACLLIGITLLTGLSWFKLLEMIGAGALRISSMVHERLFEWVKQPGWPQWLNVFRQWVEHIKSLKLFKSHKSHKSLKHQETQDNNLIIHKEIKPKSDKKRSIGSKISNLVKKDKPAELMPNAADISQAIKKAPRYKKSKVIPKLSLLDPSKKDNIHAQSNAELEARSQEVEKGLADFGVDAKVVSVYPGPVVTRFELELAAGTKVSKVTGLALDLARSLSVTSVRVVGVIPGKSVIGLELPNDFREMVSLQEVLGSKQYQHAHAVLTLALGKDIAGHPVIVDLAKMPHLLVAGTTGSGKSVCLNATLLSLLYKSTPEQLRLILIDPKMLELAIYDGIPHLLTPVVTDMKDAARALRWCVVEMERRYRLMAALGVRNVAGYNEKVKAARDNGAPLLDPLAPTDGESIELQTLPQIVVLADEFADMMMVVGKKVETLIARLAQKARAAGVHLILATQRPSVDVITGLIKANIPTRIAFQVSSKIDSRTILDQQGAEHLLGHGDMLYLAPGTGVPTRVHGAFVSDDEVHRVVAYLKEHGEPDYLEDILDEQTSADPTGFTEAMIDGDDNNGDSENDPLYDQAVEFVVQSRRASISSVQRHFRIGYNRAARIIEAMEAAGVVSKLDGSSRDVLAPPPS